jgi:hypothetical protein
MVKNKKTFWYYWSKALGEKAHRNCNKTSDVVAYIRTAITLQIILTNFFIIFGNIYNFTKPTIEVKCIERTK